METAQQLGIRTDYDRPIETFAHSHPTVSYPCYPKEITLDFTNMNVYIARGKAG